MSSYSPEDSAGVHRAEIHLTIALNPEKTLATNETLSSLRVLREECEKLLLRDSVNSSPEEDRIDFSRLKHINRAVKVPIHYLNEAQLRRHPDVASNCAEVVSAYCKLGIEQDIHLVRGLARFLNECDGELRDVALSDAKHVVPALHVALEGADEKLCEAAGAAAVSLLRVADRYVRLSASGPQRSGMIALAEIAVSVVAMIVRRVDDIRRSDRLAEGLRILDGTLRNACDAEVLREDLALITKLCRI